MCPSYSTARDPDIAHAPNRKHGLSASEKKLALANALRYFPAEHHEVLAPEFAQELEDYGHIYMYRFLPTLPLRAYPLDQVSSKYRVSNR